MAERLLAVVAAGLGVVAGVLAVWGTQTTAERDDLQATTDSVVDERDALSRDLADADQQIADLEAAASTTTSTSSTSTTAGEGAGPVAAGPAGVFRETGATPVTFARGYGIDLDTRDVNWGIDDTGGDVSLGMHDDGLSLFVPSRTIALLDADATYDDCESQTVLQESFGAEWTVVGQRFCMKTSEDRWAFVTILGVDAGRETVTLDVTVWTLQNE